MSVYKVSDGSVITFKKRGPELSAILTTPDGKVITGPSRMGNTEEKAAREILLASNIVDPTTGDPLPYTIEGSPPPTSTSTVPPAGLQQPTPPPLPLKPNAKVTITGKVIDSISKKPIELIIVTNGSDSVETNKNGEFVLEYIYAPDKGNITFFGIGYTPFSKDISTEPNNKIALGEVLLESSLKVLEIIDY